MGIFIDYHFLLLILIILYLCGKGPGKNAPPGPSLR